MVGTGEFDEGQRWLQRTARTLQTDTGPRIGQPVHIVAGMLHACQGRHYSAYRSASPAGLAVPALDHIAPVPRVPDRVDDRTRSTPDGGDRLPGRALGGGLALLPCSAICAPVSGPETWADGCPASELPLFRLLAASGRR